MMSLAAKQYMYQYLLPITVGLIIWCYLYGEPHYRFIKRAQIKRQPFTRNYRQILKKRMPYFAKMPSDLQLQLKKHILVFLADFYLKIKSDPANI